MKHGNEAPREVQARDALNPKRLRDGDVRMRFAKGNKESRMVSTVSPSICLVWLNDS